MNSATALALLTAMEKQISYLKGWAQSVTELDDDPAEKLECAACDIYLLATTIEYSDQDLATMDSNKNMPEVTNEELVVRVVE